jgi:hypothetical protein
MKTEELVKYCKDRMKSIRDKIETKRKSKKVYSEEEVLEFANWCRVQDNKYPNRVITIQQLFEQFKKK